MLFMFKAVENMNYQSTDIYKFIFNDISNKLLMINITYYAPKKAFD